jgi:hypothetical protein
MSNHQLEKLGQEPTLSIHRFIFFYDRCPALHVARPKYALLQSYLAFFDLPYTVESQYIAGGRARTEVQYATCIYHFITLK